jgi:dCMP deaminase
MLIKYKKDAELPKQIINTCKITILASELSTCSRHKVACIVTSDNFQTNSSGRNGVPSGKLHCNVIFKDGSKFNPFINMCHHEWSSLNEIHAEINCINFLKDNNNNYKGTNIFITHSPCIKCANKIKEEIENGVLKNVKNLFFLKKYKNHEESIKILLSSKINIHDLSDIDLLND